MIAPLRETETVSPDRPELREARRYLAATLLGPAENGAGPAVSAWQAWTLVAWIVLVVAAYAGSMLGWW